MTRQYRAISADSHLEIPADRWVHRVPAQYREMAPRRIPVPGGQGEAQFIEGQPLRVEPGRQLRDHRTRYEPLGGFFDTNDGSGPPEQRVAELDEDGVDAEVLFPSPDGPNLWRGGIKDDEAYTDIVRAYNDWLAEEYCAYAPDRLLGLGLIPEVDARSAIAELEHCKEIGLTGVQLNSFPAGKMYPTPEDDVFWAAAVEIDLPLTAHVCFQFGGANYDGPLFQYPKKPEGPVKKSGSDPLTRFFASKTERDVIRLVFSGVFDRFPSLQIYFAETQLGWIPQWTEKIDDSYWRYNPHSHEVFGLPVLPRLPSEYVKDHILWGFMHNAFGVRQRHEIGVDKIMWGSDFPHPGTNWPHSQEVIEANFAGVPDDERYQMLVGNAVRFFHLD